MSNRNVALVLSGGANRGALQVGALRALFERGFRPDMLVGSSAGALNAAFLTPDPSLAQVERLAQVWLQTTKDDVYPGGRLALAWRALRGLPSLFPSDRFRAFLQRHTPPGLRRFGDVTHPRLYVVASRLDSGEARVFGDDPDDVILEALMASTALPPLHPPWQVNGEWLADGGIAAHLPASVALERGAGDVWGILVTAQIDRKTLPRDVFGNAVRALIATLLEQVEAETQIVRCHGGCVVTLSGFEHLEAWDYSHTAEMIAEGYRQAREQLDHLECLPPQRPSMWQRIKTVLDHIASQNGRGAPRVAHRVAHQTTS